MVFYLDYCLTLISVDYFVISFGCYPDMELEIILCQGIFYINAEMKSCFLNVIS